MAVPLNYAPHQLLKIGGPYGPEEWSVGLRLQVTYAPGTQTDEDVSQILLDAIVPKVETYWNAVKAAVHNGVGLGTVQVNHIGRDGKYTSANTVRHDFSNPVMGTGTTTSWHGPDSAMVHSLLTGVDRGYASKGRVYMPLNCVPLNQTVGPSYGSYNEGNRATYANAFVDLLEAINDLGVETGGGDVAVCVFSPGTGKKQNPNTPGEYRPVTAIRIGGQPDTQRRRINKQPDLWSTGSQTYPVAP